MLEQHAPSQALLLTGAAALLFVEKQIHRRGSGR